MVLLPRHRDEVLQVESRNGHPYESGPSRFRNGPPDRVNLLKGFGCRSASVSLGEKAESQGVKFDKAGSIFLIVSAGIVFESDVAFRVEAVG